MHEPGLALLDHSHLASLNPSEGRPQGLLHADMFRCGWRACHSLVEVYRLACVGIDQADCL
jgi:hypothetical protein